MSNITQRNFGAGELAPAFHARADHERYATGLATCRNFYIRKSGGAISRPGTKYVGESRHDDKKVRLIPWVFSETQAYVIELGDALIRIIDSTTQDYLYTATQAITGITQASPGVVTIAGHGYSNGDTVKIESVGGMTELNGRFFLVAGQTTNTFTLQEMDDTAVDTTGYTAYTSGGTAKEPFSIGQSGGVVPDTVPYSEAQLKYVTFAQSGDVMTLCHSSWTPRDLVRFDGDTTSISWRLLTKSFGTSLSWPAASAPTLADEPSGGTYGKSYYLTTAVSDAGDESNRSAVSAYSYFEHGDPDAFATSQVPTDKGATTAAYGFDFTSGGAGGTEGDAIVAGVEYGAYVIVTSTNDYDWSGQKLTIKGITHDGGTSNETITGPKSLGRVGFLSPYKQITDVLADGLPNAAAKLEVGYDSLEIYPLRVTVAAGVEDTITRYRLYRGDVNGVATLIPQYGFVAETPIKDLVIDEGGLPDYSRPPPEPPFGPDGSSLFTTASNRPAVVGYYQQRLVLGRSLFEPETTRMSRTGLYYVANGQGGKEGMGDDISVVSGTTFRLTDSTLSADASDVGQYIHIWNATDSANDGRFQITAANLTTVDWVNASGVNTGADAAVEWKIVPENFANFDVTYPGRDDNAVRFAIASGQLDRPWHYLDLGRLIIFSDNGEWIVEGDSAGVITPSQINPRKISHSGSGYIRPLAINNTALFVQGNRKTVRDLVYDQQSTGYQGNDLTVFSQHLFDGVTVEDWTYQQDPDSVVWMVLSDGVLLSMSYLRDFNMYGWARHDTAGTSVAYESVCSVPNGSGRDDVYVAVKRTINGRTFRSIEVMSDRFDTTDANLIASDATVTYDGSAANTMTITPASAEVYATVNAGSGANVVRRDPDSDTWVSEAISSSTPYSTSGFEASDGTRHVFVVDTISHLWEYNSGTDAWVDHGAMTSATSGQLHALSEDDVWLPTASRYVESWNRTTGFTVHDVSTGLGVRLVWAISATEVIMVGLRGTSIELWKYDGSTWTLGPARSKASDSEPNSIFSPDGSNIYIGLQGGDILHSDDAGVTFESGYITLPSDAGGTRDVEGIWGVSSTDLWATLTRTSQSATDTGHYNGTTWTEYSLNSTDPSANNNGTISVWGARTGEVYVLQYANDNVSTWNGTSFSTVDIGSSGATALPGTRIWCTGVSTYALGTKLTITSSTSYFVAGDVGRELHFTQTDGTVVKVTITAYVSATIVKGTTTVAVPAEFQAVATNAWAKAASTVEGLWHLEGENVSVFGDSTVIASPNNSAYTTVTVSSGSITLAAQYAKMHIGLPIVSDLETLNIDNPEIEVVGEQKIVTRVAMSLRRSSRCWVGAAKPSTNTALTDLDELDIHAEAGGTDQASGAVSLASKVVDQQVRGDWNSHGRVFIRHVDPIPLNVLSISPAVLTGPRGAGRRR